jgi:hypothetical protein
MALHLQADARSTRYSRVGRRELPEDQKKHRQQRASDTDGQREMPVDIRHDLRQKSNRECGSFLMTSSSGRGGCGLARH